MKRLLRNHGPLLGVLLLALVLRTGAAFVWEGRLEGRFFFGDSEGYWRLGQRIAAGDPYEVYHRVAFRTPGYPMLLAPVFQIGGRDVATIWGRFENILLGTLLVAVVWGLGLTLFDRRTAFLGALFAAVLPNLVIHSVLVLAETPFTLMMLAGLWIWGIAWKSEALGRRLDLAAVAGVVFGIAVLIRPSCLLFPPFAVGAGMLLGLRQWRRTGARHLQIAAGLVAGMIVVMAPWWIRNARVTGRFIPTSTQVGASLYDGLNPRATGGSDMAFVDRGPFDPKRYAALTKTEREIRIDAEMKRAAIDWAKANPGHALQLAATKLWRMWSPVPNEASLRSGPAMAAMAFSFGPVFLLAAAGIVWTFRRGFPYWLLWLPAIYFTLLHVVFVSSIRYRMPAMPGLCLLAAFALSRIWQHLRVAPMHGRHAPSK